MSDRDPDKPSMKQAMSRPDWKEFKKVIDDEMDQLRKEGVYDGTYVKVKDLPSDVNLVGSMFTLVVKRDPMTGAIIKYKARLVALGNQQQESSYDAISSQTARGASVKLLIALQAKLQAYSMVPKTRLVINHQNVIEEPGETGLPASGVCLTPCLEQLVVPQRPLEWLCFSITRRTILTKYASLWMITAYMWQCH